MFFSAGLQKPFHKYWRKSLPCFVLGGRGSTLSAEDGKAGKCIQVLAHMRTTISPDFPLAAGFGGIYQQQSCYGVPFRKPGCGTCHGVSIEAASMIPDCATRDVYTAFWLLKVHLGVLLLRRDQSDADAQS